MMTKRSICFDDCQTADFGFTLTALEVGLPEVREKTLEVPGLDGVLDYTETAAGRPIYGNRLISITLESSVGKYSDREIVFEAFKDRFHGQQVRIRLPGEAQRYFVGRIHIRKMHKLPTYGCIALECNCEPWHYWDMPCVQELPVRKFTDNALYGQVATLLPEHSDATVANLFNGDAAIWPSATMQGSRSAKAVWEIQLEPNRDFWVSARITEGLGYWCVSNRLDTAGSQGAIRTGADGKLYFALQKFSAGSVRLSGPFLTPAEDMAVLEIGKAPTVATLQYTGDTIQTISVSLGTKTIAQSNQGVSEVFLEPGLCPAVCYAKDALNAPILRWRRGDL